MPVIEKLICSKSGGSIGSGGYRPDKKSKLGNFEHNEDLHEVKTFYGIAKLRRNGMLVYESVPDTVVEHFEATDQGVEFSVESDKGARITVQLEDDVEYAITVDGVPVGGMKTNMSGKLNASVELNEGVPVQVRVAEREE